MKNLIRFFYRLLNRRLAIGANVSYCSDLRVGAGTTIKAPDRIDIGRRVVIAAYTTIACNGKIGNGVLISSHVGIVGRYDHDFLAKGCYISEAPWVYSPDSRSRDRRDEIIIEDDVWIGFGSIILSGITVGRGAIIAAGTTVINDIDPYAMVAGNPAKKIGERFSGHDRISHEKILHSTFNK